MPRYFFNLATREGYSRDEEGCEFDTFEAAYVEACRAALEMTIERMRNGQDLRGNRFEICDQAGQLVSEVPFNELLTSQTPDPRARNAALRDQLAAGLERSRALQLEMNAGLSEARATLATTRALLRRS